MDEVRRIKLPERGSLEAQAAIASVSSPLVLGHDGKLAYQRDVQAGGCPQLSDPYKMPTIRHGCPD
ncbi:MAG: hypothetical protein OXR66_03025 [Candidatus Woesearchaeota archaeon]|nr:hypothetical protein [Candidatus Woesearchaeota archaeon]